MDGEILISALVGVALGVPGVYCLCRARALRKEVNAEFSKNPYFAEPNDDGKNVSLFSVRFIGMFGHCFAGKFRPALIEEHKSYVTYHCSLFLYFISPGTCYRVIPLYGGTSYHIIGSESPDKREISSVKMNFYGYITFILGIAALAMSICLALC